eukprot:GHVN01063372.1.p1 GENE.GHVN01063372.1~~GHVN01063372.1.p1  ORF type:complete len:263 (+),score=9.79 GHVN01063372.1:52-840(+)
MSFAHNDGNRFPLSLHEGLNYASAFCWFGAYVSLFTKVAGEKNILGVSLQSLTALVVAEINGFLIAAAQAWYTGSTLDADVVACAAVTTFSSIIALYVVSTKLSNTYEEDKDSFGKFLCPWRSGYKRLDRRAHWMSLYALAFIFCLPLWFMRRSVVPSVISLWECFDDMVLALAFVPQLSMFYSKRPRRISKPLGTFVVLLLLARVFTLVYWATFPQLAGETPVGRGVHIVTEICNVAILADFVYYYLASASKGLPSVYLPV